MLYAFNKLGESLPILQINIRAELLEAWLALTIG